MNLLAFVENDSLNYFDPDGRAKSGWTLSQILGPKDHNKLSVLGLRLKEAEKSARLRDAQSMAVLEEARNAYHAGLVEAAGTLAAVGAKEANIKQIADVLDAALSGRKSVIDPEAILKLGYGFVCVQAVMKVYNCYASALDECERQRCDRMAEAAKRLCTPGSK